MRTKQFLAIEKRLLPSLPGFVIKGRLLFIVPLGHTLRGFHVDGSSFDKQSFYVNAFFMPLYVPSEHLHLTFGRRLRGGGGWSTATPGFELVLEAQLQKEVPFLDGLKTARDVANALKPFAERSNPHSHEALAYTLVQAGEIRAAVSAIDTLLGSIEAIKRVNPQLTWELAIAARAQLVRNKLTEDLESATAQLAVWENETIRNLGLENFSDSQLGTSPICF